MGMPPDPTDTDIHITRDIRTGITGALPPGPIRTGGTTAPAIHLAMEGTHDEAIVTTAINSTIAVWWLTC